MWHRFVFWSTYPTSLCLFALIDGFDNEVWIFLEVFHHSLTEFKFARKLDFVTFDDLIDYLPTRQKVVMVF